MTLKAVGGKGALRAGVAVVACILGALPATAAPNWVDPSFGGGAPLVFDLGPGADRATDLVVQPDGKVVVVGTKDEAGIGASHSDIAVLRLLPDGHLDPTFGLDGRVVIDKDGGFDVGEAVALQPDGRILVAGAVQVLQSDWQSFTQMAVFRLNPDGGRDATFSGGLAVFDRLASYGVVSDLAVQPDGRVLVAGTALARRDPTLRGTDFMVARVMPDGTPDASFGDGGTVLTDVGGTTLQSGDHASAVALQPDGRIIVAGSDGAGAQAMVRYTASGALDPFFGNQGRAVGPVQGHISDVTLKPDGTILTAGHGIADGGELDGMSVSRYRSDGSIDPSFGVAGMTITEAPSTEGYGWAPRGSGGLAALTIDRRGRIIAVGGATGPGGADFAAVRFNAAGGLDRGFGRAGLQKTDLRGQSDVLRGAGLLLDGRVVVAGSSYSTTTEATFVVFAYPAGDAASSAAAWGFNSVGMVGDGTTANAHAPRPVLAPATVQAVVAGAVHNLALDDAGRVFGWGWNAFGQVGEGSTEERLRPVAVPGLTGMSGVGAGYFHSLAIRGGLVYSWGWNIVGQLGDGTTVDRHQPVQVPGVDRVVAVTGGAYHSLALRDDGTVWAWGWNGFGQVGDGTTVDRHTPVPVVGLTDVVAIAAGAYHSLALKGDGTIFAWGWNHFGQLGDTTLADHSSPVRAYNGGPVIAIAAGAYHSLALLDRGSVEGWGFNGLGQLGDGTTVDRVAGTPAVGISDARAIAGGLFHSVAVGVDGRVRAWGWNGAGQLGDGSVVDRLVPVLTLDVSRAATVAAGAYHSLALAGSG